MRRSWIIAVLSGGYYSRTTGTRTYMRRFSPSEDTKFVRLEVTVNRPLAFEFMVNPKDIQRAEKNSTQAIPNRGLH